MGSPYLTDEEHEAFEAHLESCAECAREYEESRFVISLVKRYWTVSEDTLALIEKANQPTKSRMTVKESWEDRKDRIPKLAPLENHRKRFRLFRRVGVVAACLAIGISILLTFFHSKAEIAQEPVAEQVALVPEPSIKIELVSENGNILIPADHEITTADELKTLLINDKHQMLMNTNASLLIEPLGEKSRIGCMVILKHGEIYTSVEHDGKPFVVSTTNGKSVINGTIFDIKATDISTTLVVTEGTVQFESSEGMVKVAAGKTFQIIAQSAPTKPVSCNTVELTAWVTNYETQNTLAQIEVPLETYDITDLSVFVTPEQIDLERINYEQWIEQKREWFKQQFPWIWQLKDALAYEGIEVDYPELLIKTGDVWQFIFFDTVPARFSIVDPNSLINVACDYGFSKQCLPKIDCATCVSDSATHLVNAPAGEEIPPVFKSCKARFTPVKVFHYKI